MHFQSISLLHYRNHRGFQRALHPVLNAIVGPNGIGKTNVLDALQALCLTRGFGADRDALMKGESFFMVEGHLTEPAATVTVQYNYLEGKGKKLLVNGEALPRMSAHLGRIPVVSILPNDTDLVRGAAADRRKWLDALLCQLRPDYLGALQRYEHALQQRNALLQQAQESGRVFSEQLQLWESPLAEAGVAVVQARVAFFANFRPTFIRSYASLAGSTEVPGLAYQTAVSEATLGFYTAQLHSAQPAEVAAGRTLFGPHRDDLVLTLNGHTVKSHGSQGQQKTYVIALKLAQHAYMQANTGKAPILLLDDIFERLDAERTTNLFQWLATHATSQIFLTDTSAERTRRVLKAVAGLQCEVIEIKKN